MKKYRVILLVWFFTLVLTCVTLFVGCYGWLPSPVWELFLIIEGSVIAELILIELSDRLRKPTIFLAPVTKMSNIGFYVRIKDKNIDNAQVFCDNTPIKWRERDGREKETRNLRVGELAYFYPFKIALHSRSIEANEQIIDLEILQRMITYGKNFTQEYERIVYTESFSIPRGEFEEMLIESKSYGYFKIRCEIRLIGGGIEEDVKRLVSFRLWSFSFWRSKKSDLIDDVTVDSRCDDNETLIY